MRNGCDTWVGCGEGFRLLDGLIEKLHRDGYFFLCQVAYPEITTIWRQEWKNSEMVGLVIEQDELLWR